MQVCVLVSRLDHWFTKHWLSVIFVKVRSQCGNYIMSPGYEHGCAQVCVIEVAPILVGA